MAAARGIERRKRKPPVGPADRKHAQYDNKPTQREHRLASLLGGGFSHLDNEPRLNGWPAGAAEGLISAAEALHRGGFGGRGCSTRREWAFAAAIVHASITSLAAEALAPKTQGERPAGAPLAVTTNWIVMLASRPVHGQALIVKL
jgi:hypothetical protein